MLKRMMSKNRIRNIMELLEVEKVLIINGPLSDLTKVVDSREKHLRALIEIGHEIEGKDLESLQAKACENRGLLEVSLAGIQSAKRLIGKQKTDASSLGTYTNSGVKLDSPRQSLEPDRRV